jgi:phasin
MPENTARNVAQKATAYTTDTLEKVKTTAEETTKAVEQSYLTASKDFNLKLIDMAQDNMNAAFDFARQLSHVKSPSEFFELSTSHARKQFEKLTAQSQHLTGLARKGITEAGQSLQTGAGKASTSIKQGHLQIRSA